MIERTAVVVGPGGVGKSPLDALFRDGIIRIDPYRLRASGPRDAKDVFCAHPKLRGELLVVLSALDDRPLQIGSPERPIEWFPKSKVLFFKVREDWQFVMLAGLEGQIAKAEIYAPLLPILLSHPEISSLLGSRAEVIILNPAPESVTVMRNWKGLEEKTRQNCTKRGDAPESIAKRVRSVAEEAPAWIQLIQEHAATEYRAWAFPEYRYKRASLGVGIVEHQKQILIKARHCLLEGNPDLGIFFNTDDEIERMNVLDGVDYPHLRGSVHFNLGFYHSAELADPVGLMEGTGKKLRHCRGRADLDIDNGKAYRQELARQMCRVALSRRK